MSGMLCAHIGGGAAELELNISNLVRPNIQTLLSNAGWDGFAPVRLIVSPGALLNTLIMPEIVFPVLPVIVVGAGALVGGRFNGGDAVYTRIPIAIENYGSIKGGGGKGGGGGSATITRDGNTGTGSGGDGGAGQGFAASSLTIQSATPGYSGSSVTITGESWGGGDSGSATARGGSGGYGGPWRSAGASGQPGSFSGSYSSASTSPPQPGAAAGLNVNGIEYVTWLVRGDA